MKRALALLFLFCAMAMAPAARAQLTQLPLPQTPNVTGVIDQAADSARQATQGALADARRLQVRNLLQANRRELEADPAGEPIVRRQILALGMSEAAIDRARDQGFEIVRNDPIDETTSMITLRARRGLSTRRALRLLREADPQGTYDFDHLHLQSGAAETAPTPAQTDDTPSGPRIGLIDSGVAASVRIAEQRAFTGEAPVPAAHGTTIASTLSSAAPGARIFVADIYAGAPTGGASSALARALVWLASKNTRVINVSLVGPSNRIVEAVVARMVAHGVIIVAAVGNDGPAAAPLFPAAYAGVVGVTGVDTHNRVLIEAGRGPQVDFSAFGIYGRERGTSYAAPIVAARLALIANSGAPNPIDVLRGEALDLGARGRDDIYGYGLIASP